MFYYAPSVHCSCLFLKSHVACNQVHFVIVKWLRENPVSFIQCALLSITPSEAVMKCNLKILLNHTITEFVTRYPNVEYMYFWNCLLSEMHLLPGCTGTTQTHQNKNQIKKWRETVFLWSLDDGHWSPGSRGHHVHLLIKKPTNND